jgi:GMP synthase-like glutamine amidotransferase
VTVLDNRGVGRSSTPLGSRWSIGDFARDALAVLDGLQIGRAHMIGSSLGAGAAQELAAAAPAPLTDRARRPEIELVIVRADRRHALAEPAGFRFAFALGSDHGAGARNPPWVTRELAWLRHAHQQSLPVLGICFGAQALAVGLGREVRRATRPEVGWVSVQTDDQDLIGEGPWFAWHEDVLQLPDVATDIARSDFVTQTFTAAANRVSSFTLRSPRT